MSTPINQHAASTDAAAEACNSADELAALFARRAADALDAYADALTHAATVAFDGAAIRHYRAHTNNAARIMGVAQACRLDASTLA